MNSSIPQNPRFDLITCSQELKRQIVKRIAELNVSLFNLCEQLDFNYKHVRHWLNTSKPLNGGIRFKQWHVIKIAESLGIDLRLTIVVKPKATAYAIPYDPKHKRSKKQVNG